jgi:hypothetical protein
VTDPTAHLTDWTLEQLAEESLPEAELAGATAHVEACALCAAELEGYRALFSTLSDLPRFAPPPAFADAVMARVRVAPQPSPVWVRVQRWLPRTRGGWAVLGAALAAPAAPLVALVVWFLSQPLVSTSALGAWATEMLRTAAGTALAEVLGWGVDTGVFGWVQLAYQTARSIPLETVGVVLALLAVAIPLSAWSLVRLVRAPMGNATYAN